MTSKTEAVGTVSNLISPEFGIAFTATRVESDHPDNANMGAYSLVHPYGAEVHQMNLSTIVDLLHRDLDTYLGQSVDHAHRVNARHLVIADQRQSYTPEELDDVALLGFVWDTISAADVEEVTDPSNPKSVELSAAYLLVLTDGDRYNAERRAMLAQIGR